MPANGPLSALEDNGDAVEIMFPQEDLLESDHWVTFRAFETTQINRSEKGTKKEKCIISLPIPANLSTAYNLQYTETDLGAVGSVITDVFGSGATQKDAIEAAEILIPSTLAGLAAGGIVGGLANRNSGADAIISGIVSGMASGAIAAGVTGTLAGGRMGSKGAQSAALARGADIIGGNDLTKAIAAQKGLAANPHKVMLFNGNGFRTHQFNYSFSPKSYDEAVTLNNIIRKMKFYANPSFETAEVNLGTDKLGKVGSAINTVFGASSDGKLDVSVGKHFFKYPEYFEIKFRHPDFLFNIGPSVIESFSVNYHGGGVPSYSRTQGREPTPTQINIEMSFKETEIITKERIRDENR